MKSVFGRRKFLKQTALAATSVLAACQGRGHRPPPLILVVADTLRADHVGCCGNTAGLTPNIDRLAETATCYTRAFSTASWTLSSHASMFTGLFPFQHGANYQDQSFPANPNVRPLADEFTTLAEVLGREGYATGAVSANEIYVTEKFGLCQGFVNPDVRFQYAPQINLRTRVWFDSVSNGPFFLYINYMDTHFPFNNTPCPRVTSTRVKGDMQLLDRLRKVVLPLDATIPREETEYYGLWYRLGVANVDLGVSELIRHLERLGVYDDSLFIFVSDHGESLGQRHLIEHSLDLYQECIHVPLVIKSPRQKKGNINETPISLADLPSLILSEMPRDIRDRWAKTFPYEPGNHIVLAEQYYTLIEMLLDPTYGKRFNRKRKAVIEWPYKYIDSTDGQNELFQIDEDPREEHNLVESQSDKARALQQQMERFIQQQAEIIPNSTNREPVKLSPEEQERFKALGYL